MFSSAGVPKKTTVPFSGPFSICSLIAIAAPRLAAPNMLWPQPCPAAPGTSGTFSGTAFCDSPGNASYSPMTPMIGRPSP